MTTLDARGAAVLERRIDGNGFQPAIETVAPPRPGAGRDPALLQPVPRGPGRRDAVGHARGGDAGARAEGGRTGPGGRDADGAPRPRRSSPSPRPGPESWSCRSRAGRWSGTAMTCCRITAASTPSIRCSRRWASAPTPCAIPTTLCRSTPRDGWRSATRIAMRAISASASRSARRPTAWWRRRWTAGRTIDSFDPAELKDAPNALFGNYVVIRHADGLFSILGHIHQASLKVKVGDVVKAGQSVAAIGASGSSLFPHLHYQLMVGPSMRDEGAPSGFSGLDAGARHGAHAGGQRREIDSGDVVEGASGRRLSPAHRPAPLCRPRRTGRDRCRACSIDGPQVGDALGGRGLPGRVHLQQATDDGGVVAAGRGLVAQQGLQLPLELAQGIGLRVAVDAPAGPQHGLDDLRGDSGDRSRSRACGPGW